MQINIRFMHYNATSRWITQLNLLKFISNFHPNEGESWMLHLDDKNDILKSKYYFQTVNSIFLQYIFPPEQKIHFLAKIEKQTPPQTAKCVFSSKNVKKHISIKHTFRPNQ